MTAANDFVVPVPAWSCIICHSAYSVVDPFMGMAGFFFTPYGGMCAGCDERWRKSPECAAACEALGKYRSELRSLVEQFRTKVDPTKG